MLKTDSTKTNHTSDVKVNSLISGANNYNGSEVNVTMTTEPEAKVFKSELVVMSLQPAAPSTTGVELTLPEENAEQKNLSHQLQPQLKSPTKITSSNDNSSSEHDFATEETFSFESRRITTLNVKSQSLSTEPEATPQVKINLISKTSISSRDLSLGISSGHHAEKLLDGTASVSNEAVSVTGDPKGDGNANISSQENKTDIKQEIISSRNPSVEVDGIEKTILPSDERLVLPAGIQELLDGDVDCDSSSESDNSDRDETDVDSDECFTSADAGNKLELPLGIKELIEGDFKENPEYTTQTLRRRECRSVGDLKDLFSEKIVEASGRRNSVESNSADFTLGSEGIRSRSSSVSSGKIALPEGIKDLISGTNSVRNKVSAFEVKSIEDDSNMETTKLSPRDKIDVDLVGKRFKQIQKTMKNISGVKEKTVQKPIVPAVGVNSKIKAFEKNTNGLDTEKKVVKTAYVANRGLKGNVTEKKEVKTQAEKIPANKDKVRGSKETSIRPPLAQNLFNRVIMETPKVISEAVRPVKETNVPIKLDSVKQETAKQWDVPLVQKLLHDVVKDVKEEVQKKEENLKVQGKVAANKKNTTVKIHSQNMEKNDDVFTRKLPVSKKIRKDETDIASSLSEDRPESFSELERRSRSISTQPQTLNDKESDGPISIDGGTTLSHCGVREEKDVENMTAIHREPLDPSLAGTTIVMEERPTLAISEINTVINSEGKGNKSSATPVTTTTFDEVDVQVTKVTSSASNRLDLHERKRQTSRVQVQSNLEAEGVAEKDPEDATASMAKKSEAKPSHLKDQSADDSEKTPDSPSETKVTNAPHLTKRDQVSTLRTKKATKEEKETKCKNNGSVLSMIKKIQKTANKEKEKTQPRGKVRISSKFDVNGDGKEDHTFKYTDRSVHGKTEKISASAGMEQQNEKRPWDAIDDPDERDMTDKGFRDAVAAKLKRLSHGDEDKDAMDTVAKAKTKSETFVFKQEEPVNVNGKIDDEDSNDNYTELSVDNNCKGNDALELGNGLGKNIMGNTVSVIASLENSTSQRGNIQKSQNQNQEPTKSSLDPSTVPARETKDVIQSNFAEKTGTSRAKETSRSTTTGRKANSNTAQGAENRRERKGNNDDPDNRDFNQASVSLAGNENIEDAKSHDGSVSEKNMGASESNSLTSGKEDIITEMDDDNTVTTDQLNQLEVITDSLNTMEDFGNDEEGTNMETISSFTKHELFFTSAIVDDSPDDGEDEVNAENLKKHSRVLSDTQDTLTVNGILQQNNTNASSKNTIADISMKKNSTMKLVDESSFENVWNIVEGKSDKMISEDAESDNISNSNKSLSASTASLDSNFSSDVMKLKDEHLMKVDVSKARKKSSGNKMSKPECMQRNSCDQSLDNLDEILLENKENLNTKSQPRKTIDIRIFEALKVYLS